MIGRIRELYKNKKPGKTDWLILILVGVLLMVVVWPTASGNDESSGTGSVSSADREASDGGSSSASAANGQSDTSGTSDLADGGSSSYQQAYADALEDELEELLAAMEGVGEVRVMITLEDDGETVLQQDSSRSSDSSSDTTVVLEQGDDELPYITSQAAPTVRGVVVVAQGAGSGSVSTEITEAVMALFSIEAHKVKVLRMG